MMRKMQFPWLIAGGLLGLGVILLLAGCLVPPLTRQVSTVSQVDGPVTTQPSPIVLLGPNAGNATPLPSGCTSVEVESHPGDAFRLKIQVKNSAGAPASGARVRVTFYNGDPDGPVQIWADDQGIAALELTAEQLASPQASGRTLRILGFDLNAFWNNPNAGPEYVATCASQDIDLAAPAEIVVTVTLLP